MANPRKCKKTPKSIDKPKTKRQRSVLLKRKMNDVFLINPLEELNQIPTNADVMGLFYGAEIGKSFVKKIYPIARKVKAVFDKESIVYSVGLDQIAQGVKKLLKEYQTIQKNLNLRMNERVKKNKEAAFVRKMTTMFSVGEIPAAVNPRNANIGM